MPVDDVSVRSVDSIRIANCSGFFGDRISAAREMVEDGPIDVLSGDWLAELTMLILAKQRRRDPRTGFARTFLTQLEEVLGTCLERGIKIVSNAGGLNPRGCSDAVEELARRLGLAPVVATVSGDNVLDRLDQLRDGGEQLQHMDTGARLEQDAIEPLTANVYLGHRGITEALRRGADVVVTGRVADAALVVGPAAWRFDWQPHEWDRLAGAMVAGHIIECGAQATGGNFAFFEEVPGLEHCGFPIAEVSADGSSIITKHEGTGGMVTVETVTAQLLYEIGGARYLTPDVVCRLDTVRLQQVGPDRVQVSGTRGEPAPRTLKAGINYLGGYRNSVTFVLPGLDVLAKAKVVEDSLFASIPGGKKAFDEVAVDLEGGIDADGAASDGRCTLRVTVLGQDPELVGRGFSNAAVELVLASYPGFHTTGPPTAASEYGVFWPTTVERRWVSEIVEMAEEHVELSARLVDSPLPVQSKAATDAPDLAEPMLPTRAAPRSHDALGPRRTAGEGTLRLGRILGARSGDKGGNANLGVWARSDAVYEWLRRDLTPERLQSVLPDTSAHEVTRYDLPNLRACNFIIKGLLGRGVAASTRFDPQAKGLGEELRAVTVEVPSSVPD